MVAGAVAVTMLLYLNKPPTEIKEPQYTPVTVDAAEVILETIRIPVQAQGIVSPLRETELQAEVRGRVVEASPNFNVGSFVEQDEVLLRIDPRDYQTSLLRAQAAVESAESSLAQEKGRAQVALKEWQKLPKGSQRSPEARDLYLRKPQLELAEAQLLAARADLNTARDNLERTIVRAPYRALIREKNTELGQFVNIGSKLAHVFAVELAEVRLPIPQTRLPYLDIPGVQGYDTAVSIDLYTDVAGTVRHWDATLHRTEGVYDERSRALFTVARVEDPYALEHPGRAPLRMGTFVNANIIGKAIPGLVALPRHILRAGNQIWIIDEDKRLRNRTVSILRTGGDEIFVSAGLDSGELVSLTALDSNFEGAEVDIVSRRMTSDRDAPEVVVPEQPEAPELSVMPASPEPAASVESSEPIETPALTTATASDAELAASNR